MNGDLLTPAPRLAAAALAVIGLLALATPAQAYVGPGMALGALGAGFGLLMTGASAVFYLSAMWMRRLWRRVTGRALPVPELPADATAVRPDP